MLKTTFVDEFQLTAEVSSEHLRPGKISITVENPAYGSGRARGVPDLSQLGVLDHISNSFLILARPAAKNP